MAREDRVEGRSIEVGEGNYRYRVIDAWPMLPEGMTFKEVVAVASDSAGRVLVFNRGAHPVATFDSTGRYLHAADLAEFSRPHGITIGPDDVIYCVDDFDHTVRAFTHDGQLLLTLGTSGQYSDTGARSIDYRTITHSGPPFNYPTNLAIASCGDLYVTDGYGNARVHRFSADGQLLDSWGEPGQGPGQFHVPHGICISADDLVYVADRENSRIQRFDLQGQYIDQWSDVVRPCEVFAGADGAIYVAELGFRAGRWPGWPDAEVDAIGGRVSIFDSSGRLLARWGGGLSPTAPGDFFAPHDIWVDAAGDIYVSEVVWSAGAKKGLVRADCHTLQKFSRIGGE